GQSSGAVSYRVEPTLDAEELGSDTSSSTVFDRWRRNRSAVRCAVRRDRRRCRSCAPTLGGSAARAGGESARPMSLVLIHSERFVEHQTPPGHPERPERAEVFDAVAGIWRKGGGDVDAPRAATGEQHERDPDEAYRRRY